jgi:hypothetical protein
MPKGRAYQNDYYYYYEGHTVQHNRSHKIGCGSPHARKNSLATRQHQQQPKHIATIRSSLSTVHEQ